MRFRRDQGDGESIINLESLLDVMFILLIFFMATTTFKQEEHDKNIQLTSAQKQRSSLSEKKKVIVINVRSGNPEGNDPLYVIESKKVTLLELRKLVAEGLQRDKEMKVLVRGDKLALHGNVARAIAACYAEGISDAKIGYIHVADE
ncbi:MAG: biopolymer transporter ExbD [Phycisphaerales bacterium]|jgi:biopolymer transport protein ExbD|nr:biopolymer transporter ExbD [Phycisphaerales bacterium]